METNQTVNATYVINSEQLLEHWQGHRNLTRKIIEAFPEDKLFEYSIGGMRPFAVMVMELIDLASGGISGMVTGNWSALDEMPHATGNMPKTKADLLKEWDKVTEQLNSFWPELSEGQFQEVVMAFGAYEGPVYSNLLYFIDNEIHHRGQAYVYLRSLGTAPPPFWERY